MKGIADVFENLQDEEFFENQFKECHPNKNVLFVNPQLNGRHFYKYLTPYVFMYEFDIWATALTSIDKYKPNKEYQHPKIPLNSKKILWADFIVIPFTNEDLTDVYNQIKQINPNVRIVFNVDFNYYQLSKYHPLFESFSSPETISIIEDNIFYSDITLVTNAQLYKFLCEKFEKELNENKYKDITSHVKISCFPILLHENLILENINPELPPLSEEEKEQLRIGIVATNYTWEDLLSYKDQFTEVQKKLGDKVKFILLGFDGIDRATNKSCFGKDFKFEIAKPSTIVHYFKHLRSLNLNMLFIPLRTNEFNITSENYNKYLEASLFEIPTMVYNISPYSEIIKNGQNGIILENKKDFIERIEHFTQHRSELVMIGKNARKTIEDNFLCNETYAGIIDDIFEF